MLMYRILSGNRRKKSAVTLDCSTLETLKVAEIMTRGSVTDVCYIIFLNGCTWQALDEGRKVGSSEELSRPQGRPGVKSGCSLMKCHIFLTNCFCRFLAKWIHSSQRSKFHINKTCCNWSNGMICRWANDESSCWYRYIALISSYMFFHWKNADTTPWE